MLLCSLSTDTCNKLFTISFIAKYRWSAYRMEIQQLTIAFLLKRQELLKHVKQVILQY